MPTIKPAYQKGNWKVTGWCCRSGLCIDCHSRGNHGHLERRVRRIITYGISRDWAEYVASNWASYEAKAQEMLGPPEVI
jgi:hypothetical protein